MFLLCSWGTSREYIMYICFALDYAHVLVYMPSVAGTQSRFSPDIFVVIELDVVK